MLMFYYKSYSHWGQFKLLVKFDTDKVIFDEIDQMWYEE